MFDSLWDDIKYQYRHGGMIIRLIIINIAGFVLVNLAALFFTLFSGFEGPKGIETVLRFLSLEPGLWHQLTHPWVFFTSMFVHVGLWHLLFNMLMLYWFGRIVENLLNHRHILPIYLISGLAGGLFYLISANFIPQLQYSFAYGASAAVMGFVFASATLTPDSRLHLLLIGPVKLKYIAFALLLLDLFSIGWMANTGGHLAHLGGAAFGYLYIRELRKGNDWSKPVNHILDAILGFLGSISFGESHRKTPLKKVYKAKGKKPKSQARADTDDEDLFQERLDAILDKIKEHGYDSLTPEEKQFLFHASKKK